MARPSKGLRSASGGNGFGDSATIARSATVTRPGGRGGNFVFVDWWEQENELHHDAFFSTSTDGGSLRAATASDLACVWDLSIVALLLDALALERAVDAGWTPPPRPATPLTNSVSLPLRTRSRHAVDVRWTPRPRTRRHPGKQKGLISRNFAKPSDGLEPSTPSL